MTTVINILIGLVSLIHLYIFVFECFLWEVRGPKVFKSFPKELFPKTKALAFNQGIYNLFLAAGLAWTFLIEDLVWKQNIAIFFLGCVFVAGLVGAKTERNIFFVQSLPALVTLLLIICLN